MRSYSKSITSKHVNGIRAVRLFAVSCALMVGELFTVPAAFAQATHWPDGAFYANESIDMVENARSLLAEFAYDVEVEPDLGPQADRDKLRREIARSKLRLVLEPTGEVTEELIFELEAAKRDGKFPCPAAADQPAPAPEHQFSKDGETSYTFSLKGYRPSLYLVRLLERLNECAGGDAPQRSAEHLDSIASEAIWEEFFGTTAGAPPPYDRGAARRLTALSRSLSHHNNSGVVALPAADITVFTAPGEYFKLSEATQLQNADGAIELAEAKKPTRREHRQFCRSIIGQRSCFRDAAIEEVTNENGEFVFEYGILIDHYSLEARIKLPSALGPALSEDVYRFLIEEYSELEAPEQKPFYAISALNYGRQNQDSGNEATVTDCNTTVEERARQKCVSDQIKKAYPDCVEGDKPLSGAKLQACIMQLARNAKARYQSELGWPSTLGSTTPKDSTRSITIVEDYTFADGNFAQPILLGTVPRDRNLLGNELKIIDIKGHSYFPLSPSRAPLNPIWAPLAMKVTSSGRPYDPTHGVFALGLLAGGFDQWRGLASPEYAVGISAPRDILSSLRTDYGKIQKAFKLAEHLRHPLAGQQNISIFIGDSAPCLADTQARHGQSPWEQNYNNLNIWLRRIQQKEEPYFLQIIAAPYGCENFAPGISPEGNGARRIACEYEGYGDEYSYTTPPYACLGRYKNNHSIIVAAANEGLTEMLDNHYRPAQNPERDSEEIEERYLLAPGCDILSADGFSNSQNPNGKAGVRFRTHAFGRGCGSSFAAPIVGALASRVFQMFEEYDKSPRGTDVKTQLIATSNAAANSDAYYGIVNFTRALESGPNEFAVWFDGFPESFNQDPDQIAAAPSYSRPALAARKDCGCYFDGALDKRPYEECYSRSAERQQFVCQSNFLKIRGAQGAAWTMAQSQTDVVALRRAAAGKWEIFSFERYLSRPPVLVSDERGDEFFDWDTSVCKKRDDAGDKPACIGLCDDQSGKSCITIDPGEFSHFLFKGWLAAERRMRGRGHRDTVLQRALN